MSTSAAGARSGKQVKLVKKVVLKYFIRYGSAENKICNRKGYLRESEVMRISKGPWKFSGCARAALLSPLLDLLQGPIPVRELVLQADEG
jgi:hypothetical protein